LVARSPPLEEEAAETMVVKEAAPEGAVVGARELETMATGNREAPAKAIQRNPRTGTEATVTTEAADGVGREVTPAVEAAHRLAMVV
jgi:hypothetical protein